MNLSCERERKSAYPLFIPWRRLWTTDGVFEHATCRSCQKGAKILRHFGGDSSTLRSELSLGHFGTSADLSGQFGPTKLVPKCLGSEVSVTPR